ncbi:MAG: type II toxin-antitoxin system death-on-curing family toxin [Blastocatellia bacterium]|nr:type II toxin-antitoxin system death-on-curing family toxin [Blastocatellia bacterium]
MIKYISFADAVDLHFTLMEMWGESRYGIEDRPLIESALARPRHAAVYENADLVRQASTLCFGLIKNHPWTGGNKRTATFLMDYFLKLNGQRLTALPREVYQMTLDVESDRWFVDEIEDWLRIRVEDYSE